MIVFGGLDTVPRNDVWALSLKGKGEWKQLQPLGAAPSPRHRATTVYDPLLERLILFGGDDGVSRLNDTWTLSLSGMPTWTELSVTGSPPAARKGCASVYDPVRGRMIIFGGISDVTLYSDAWALSLGDSLSWTQLEPTGTRPIGRWLHSAIYDVLRDRMMIFGGRYGPFRTSQTWALSLGGTPTWMQIMPPGVPPYSRSEHAAIYDPLRDRMLAFGGDDGAVVRLETMALPLSGTAPWTQLAPPDPVPYGRTGHAAIYDPVHFQMVIVGGSSAAVTRDDTWAFSFAGEPAWRELAYGVSGPGPRNQPAVIYDPARGRMVMFGGSSALDTWALSLTSFPSWSPVATSGTPPANASQAAIYDPMHDRMVVYGGFQWPIALGEAWTLSFTGTPTWNRLIASGTPPLGRARASAVYDPIGDRMLIFGGLDSSLCNEVWALSLSDEPVWYQLFPAGTPPEPRNAHAAIYDPMHHRMVVFGGWNGSTNLNDVWALSLDGTSAWKELAPNGQRPGPRAGHTAIYDPTRDRMVILGGSSSPWILTWAETTSVDPRREPSDRRPPIALQTNQPNPFNPETRIRYVIAEPGISVVLGVYDAGGRLARILTDGVAAPGLHEVVWDGRDEQGHPLGSGIYFCRLEANGFSQTTKLVLSR